MAALTFGTLTAATTHFAWLPDARLSGAAPGLTVAAGLVHAMAGALTGARLLDTTRTKTALQACLLGAGTSLLAVLLLAPALALWISAEQPRPTGASPFLLMTVFVGLFSFLAAGWALLLVSAGIGWGLHRVATSRTAA